MKTFKIKYDDQPNDVVDTISAMISKFGLEIVEVDTDQECVIEYEIKILK